GVRDMIHMHGELLKIRCARSEELFAVSSDIDVSDMCECCGEAGNVRPHVVWLGEMPLMMEEIYHALHQCDLCVAIRTSGNVYPAAGFVREAVSCGVHTLETNVEPSAVQSMFPEKGLRRASERVPRLVGELLSA